MKICPTHDDSQCWTKEKNNILRAFIGAETVFPHFGVKIPLSHYPLPIENPQGKPSRNLEWNYLPISSVICQRITISRGCTFRVDLFDLFSFSKQIKDSETFSKCL